MLQAIIVDDEINGIDSLKALIRMYINDLTIIASTTKANEATALIENHRPDIVFLDINMPEMNGFELLEKLQWKDFNLVFTTSHQEYGLRALKNNAMDYLLKPIDHEDLVASVKRIRNKLEETTYHIKFNYKELITAVSQRQKILISSRFGIEAIDLSEIVSLESQSNYTKIYLTGARDIMTSKTLKEFDTELCIDNLGFMRVHNSFIVSLAKISTYLKTSESIVMEDKQVIPVSKRKRSAFFKWLKA